MSSVMRSKYFPRVHPLEAQIGSNPSYVGRSIMAVKDITLHGTIWRIGNGRQVRVWRDKWIVDAADNMLHPNPDKEIDESLMVAELIDVDTGRWDVEKISQVVHSHDLKANFSWVLYCQNRIPIGKRAYGQ
ncbi:Putative mitochondrial protein [Glycine soja]|nr:Putative mitochondrial protein [Glycine soja]